MMHIIKDIIVNLLSIIIVGILGFLSMYLIVELNVLGIVLAIILIGTYIFLLCYFYKKIFSKRLFVSFEFITTMFWVVMFIWVNHLSNTGYWENEFFGGLAEFLTCLLSIFISTIIFIITTVILFINRKMKKR